MDDISDIAEYYDRSTEQEHIRLERHQLEHDVTWRYLERYLSASGRLLEIGAATGRYTVELARRGYAVTAVDLSAGNIEKCRQNLAAAGLEGQVALVQADARDLSAVPGRDFDAVLLMGPLYHLVERADRQAALRQATERLKAGGLIFSAFINRFGILGDLMKNVPAWIEDTEEVHSILEYGRDPHHLRGSGFRGYFARPAEIAPLHEALGLETVVLAGVEPAISSDDESYNRLEGELRRAWLDLLVEVSAEPAVMGASRHLLYIGRKN